MKTFVIALLLTLCPSLYAAKCVISGNYVVCGDHLATPAEEHAILNPTHRESDTYVGAASVPNIPRDSRGRTARSRAAKDDFKRQNPCPSTGKPYGACPGYIIDHINPLACGGPDEPSNMQWQTTEDGKEKDKWERKTCGGR